jgi:hypothetical protein
MGYFASFAKIFLGSYFGKGIGFRSDFFLTLLCQFFLNKNT